jgi:hypothetical protein
MQMEEAATGCRKREKRGPQRSEEMQTKLK